MRLPEDFGPAAFGWRTLYGHDEAGEWSRYMFRLRIGRFRLHVFYRGDADPDPHNHPWEFWTFPLTPYVEEVVEPEANPVIGYEPTEYRRRLRIVPAFRLSYRPASYTHRVLGRYAWKSLKIRRDLLENVEFFIALTDKRPVVTLVWTGRKAAKWGFLKLCGRFGEWLDWRKYIYGGGKMAPCAEIEQEKQGANGAKSG